MGIIRDTGEMSDMKTVKQAHVPGGNRHSYHKNRTVASWKPHYPVLSCSLPCFLPRVFSLPSYLSHYMSPENNSDHHVEHISAWVSLVQMTVQCAIAKLMCKAVRQLVF
jgi:hypothetical protein